MTGEAPGLRIENLSRRISDRFAVADVSFQVGRGEFVVLFGPSGCGKSSVLRMVAGLDAPDAGRIEIGGRVANDPGLRLRPRDRGIGMVFQNLALWPHYTVEKHLRYVLHGRLPRSEQGARIGEVLALVGLAGREKARPHELSGGEGQRLALARALVGRPQLLLLDEPLSGVDENLRDRLCTEIRLLQRRVAISTIYVTHHREETLSVADRIVILRDGAVEQIGPPRELYERPRSDFVARLLVSGNLLPGRFSGGRAVETAVGSVECVFENGASAPRAGQDVVVALHPTRLALTESGGTEARVVSTAFRGDRCLIRVALALAAVNGPGREHGMGQELTLWTDAEQARRLAEQAGGELGARGVAVRIAVSGPGVLVSATSHAAGGSESSS